MIYLNECIYRYFEVQRQVYRRKKNVLLSEKIIFYGGKIFCGYFRYEFHRFKRIKTPTLII